MIKDCDLAKLFDYVLESNKIERIFASRDSDITIHAVNAHLDFLDKNRLDISHVKTFVKLISKEIIRDKANLNVQVGNHYPPKGGPYIVEELIHLLNKINLNAIDCYEAHLAYEKLHPFMDGNGRSGRAIYLWQCLKNNDRRPLELGFLHDWYYKSLDYNR